MLHYEQKVLESPPRLAIRFRLDESEKEVIRELRAQEVHALAREIDLQLGLIGAANDDRHVLITFGAADYINLERKIATQIAVWLMGAFRRLEELEQADRIAYDSAILLRAGSNFALSNDPRIIGEAVKEATHNRDLRRFMTEGVRSEVALGVPTIVVKPPTEKVI